uniref:Polyprotein n=1 Tax=Cajanus cajan TaxID=3821 RepID=A0A151TPT9_CAJCA|nr:polyprotein [Cajanus cajan]
MVHPDADQYKVIEEFCANMTGTLKEWYISLGRVNQDNLHRTFIDEFLGGLQYHFLGESTLIDQIIRREYFEMRCCSLEKEDLDRNYQRMSQRFYQLNGMNDASLKNTYVSSLPEELQEEMWRILQQSNKDVLQMTMGEIYQTSISALDKICNQQRLFKKMIDEQPKYKKVCKKGYLQIKCKDSSCHCKDRSNKKKKKFKSFRKKGKKKFKFFKRKPFRGKGSNGRRFICGQKGHFSKNCPNKKKATKLISILKLEDEDVESLFDEQESPDESTVFGITHSDENDSSSEQSDYTDEESNHFPILKTEEVCFQKEKEIPLLPNVEAFILPTKYHVPIKVIAFIDTGASRTMLNPAILPSNLWTTQVNKFIAADGKTYETDLVTSSKIGIKLFPDCTIWMKVIGDSLHGKDILIDRDLLV